MATIQSNPYDERRRARRILFWGFAALFAIMLGGWLFGCAGDNGPETEPTPELTPEPKVTPPVETRFTP